MISQPSPFVCMVALTAIAVTLGGVWLLWRGGATRRGLLLLGLAAALMIYVVNQQLTVVSAG